MQLSRCRICGEAVLGEVLARCPYCAASGIHLLSPAAFRSDENKIHLTETELRDLEDITEVARALARTALGAAGAVTDDGQSALYERLAWMHAEHVRVLCALASESHGPEWLTPMSVEDAVVDIRQGIEMRLAEASGIYTEAAGRATATRVREVFTALSEADSAMLTFLQDYARLMP